MVLVLLVLIHLYRPGQNLCDVTMLHTWIYSGWPYFLTFSFIFARFGRFARFGGFVSAVSFRRFGF